LLDFENVLGSGPDATLGGSIEAAALAAKGPYLLAKQLAGNPALSVIDRRDFTTAVQREQTTNAGEPTTARVSALQAAQALRADVVLRGSLLAFSTGKQVVNQGGYNAEFTTTALRVGVEALDAVDGTVLSMVDGSGSHKVRQTAALQTVLGEQEVVDLFEQALAGAVPDLVRQLGSWQARQGERPTVALSVTTPVDPVLVEIDGVMVGTTPLEAYRLYRGDHILRLSKAGHYDVTKRILFETDTSINVPMLKVELSAEELYAIYTNAQLSVYQGIEPALVIDQRR
jgi:hypothetical protein